MKIDKSINTLSELEREIEQIDLQIDMNMRSIGNSLHQIRNDVTLAFRANWLTTFIRSVKLVPSLLSTTQSFNKKSYFAMLLPFVSKYLNKIL